jgi:hypothetical protein
MRAEPDKKVVASDVPPKSDEAAMTDGQRSVARHPVMGLIKINYDPTEPLSEDQWSEDVR